MKGLNQVFIGATVRTGARKGMIAYEPVLTAGIKNLPDEIALVSYEDKASYDALYSTDAGIAYQNLHWQYFDRSLSHSLTPVPYSSKSQKLGIEQAYDFHPEYAGWMKHQTSVLVFYRRESESDAAYLERASQQVSHSFTDDGQRDILDRALLVAQNYWLEYVSANLQLSDSDGADLVLPVKSQDSQDARITPSSGINLQF